MATVQPEGEQIRKAVKWIGEERRYRPEKSRRELIETAGIRFNLSPLEIDYVDKLLRENGG